MRIHFAEYYLGKLANFARSDKETSDFAAVMMMTARGHAAKAAIFCRVGRLRVSGIRSFMMGAAMCAPMVFTTAASAGDDPFAGLAGAWSGSGSVRLENGSTERLKCKGYYNAKANGLGMAINCGNAGFKINMRAQLTNAGGAISGTWEEREFNQTGNISGRATGSGFSLKFSGAITGSMSVTMSGSTQNVSISTGGPGFTGVNLSFAKNG